MKLHHTLVRGPATRWQVCSPLQEMQRMCISWQMVTLLHRWTREEGRDRHENKKDNTFQPLVKCA